MSSYSVHDPVLLQQAVNALQIKSDGFYIDATFGRGGHSRAILEQLGAKGHLLAIDRDPQAVAFAKDNFADDRRFEIVHETFSNLKQIALEKNVLEKVDGILVDLGVSSPQLDNAERGFSFMRDGVLDMRMDTSCGISAAEWINQADADEIADVLYEYGEERKSRRIARKIVAARDETAIETTLQLAAIIKRALPSGREKKHPATRSFQAIRIKVNEEMQQATQVLEAAIEVLSPKGRLAVISFHSLEDRLVKRFFRDNSRGKQLPREIPVQIEQGDGKLKLIGRAIKPSLEEISANSRARSSILRIAEKKK